MATEVWTVWETFLWSLAPTYLAAMELTPALKPEKKTMSSVFKAVVEPTAAVAAVRTAAGANCPSTIRSAAWNIRLITLIPMSGRENRKIWLQREPWHISIRYLFELVIFDVLLWFFSCCLIYPRPLINSILHLPHKMIFSCLKCPFFFPGDRKFQGNYLLPPAALGKREGYFFSIASAIIAEWRIWALRFKWYPVSKKSLRG